MVEALPSPQIPTPEREPNRWECASILAEAIKESTPARIFGKSHRVLSTSTGWGSFHAITTMDGHDIRVGYRDAKEYDIAFRGKPILHQIALKNELNPQYGIRIDDTDEVYTTLSQLEEKLGDNITQAAAPVLFELARQRNKLSSRTIQYAEDVHLLTIKAIETQHGYRYTSLYFPDAQSNKIIQFHIDKPAEDITQEDIDEARAVIKSDAMQQQLNEEDEKGYKVIPSQAVHIGKVDKDGKAVGQIRVDNGNSWDVEVEESKENSQEEPQALPIKEPFSPQRVDSLLSHLVPLRVDPFHEITERFKTEAIENITSIVQIALQQPTLHKRLTDTLLWSGKAEGKTLLQEVLTQLQEMPGFTAEKSLFIDGLRKRLFYSITGTGRYGKHTELDRLSQMIVTLTEEKNGDLQSFYDSVGVDFRLVNSHIGANKHKNRLDALNIVSAIMLEQIQPGMCSRLQKNNGISLFYRYPTELLTYLDSDEQRNDTNKKRSLVIVAASDHNGAFTEKDMYQKLLSLRTYNMIPMVFEVSSLEELQDLVYATRHDICNNISQLVIRGHGTTDGLQLGDGYSQDIDEHKISWLKTILDEMPNISSIILDACSTGKKGFPWRIIDNIAKKIHVALRIPVAAPRVDISSSFSVDKHGLVYKPFKGYIRAPVSRYS